MMYAIQIHPHGLIGPFDDLIEAEAVADDELARHPGLRVEVVPVSDEEVIELLILNEEVLDALYPASLEPRLSL